MMNPASVVPAFVELLKFAREMQGIELKTLSQDKRFQVHVEGDELYFRPADRAVRHAQSARVKEVLAKLQESGSWKPGDYSDKSFNASYLLALVRAWQTSALETRKALSQSVRTNLTEEERESLKSAVRSAVRHRDCAVRGDRLKHGFHVDLRSAVRDGWIGSVYWSNNALGNAVEIAFDPTRLARTPAEFEPLVRWFVATAQAHQNEPARNHSGDHHDWIRAGFEFAQALAFFQRLARHTNPVTPESERWLSDVSPAPDARAAANATPSTLSSPESASLEHMLAMARQACSQSGEIRSSVAKAKRVLFADDGAFRRHLADLLVQQEYRCAITKLPLQFEGSCADDDLLASLDRIDSDGDYSVGNLQVVCRFVNRWKSDGTDANGHGKKHD